MPLLLSACSDAVDETGLIDDLGNVVSVRTNTVSRTTLQTWIFGEGTARALQREFLSFESAGRIAFVDPNLKEGDTIQLGQVIAYQQQDRSNAELAIASARIVDAESELASNEASLEEARTNLNLAEKSFQRYEVLLQQESASLQEHDEARARLEQSRAALTRTQRQLLAARSQIESARAQMQSAELISKESKIASPINGTLARLNIEQGYYFSPQQVQATSEAGALNTVPVVIIDDSIFEITVNLPSYEFQQIETGRDVLIQRDRSSLVQATAQSMPPSDYETSPSTQYVRAEVYAVSPSVDPDTRTFAIKVRTLSEESKLQDGEFVTAWIAGPTAEQTLTISLDATRYDNGQAYVFVVDAHTNTVSRRNVELGLQGRDRQQVHSGLEENLQVVTTGRSRLGEGDSVRVLTSTGDGVGMSL